MNSGLHSATALLRTNEKAASPDAALLFDCVTGGYGTMTKAGSLHAPVLLLPFAAARTMIRVNDGKPLMSPLDFLEDS